MDIEAQVLHAEISPPSRATDSSLSERAFYGSMTAAIALVTFAGFARTFYLSAYFGTASALTPLLIIHGTVMTAWTVLLMVQSALIATRRADLHRIAGLFGVALATLMAVLLILVTVIRTREQMHSAPVLAEVVLTASVPEVLAFIGLMSAAVALRRRSEYHKRLVIMAAVKLLPAAVGRLPIIGPAGPVAFFGCSDLFVVALAVHDLIKLRRLHPATVWGAGVVLLSQTLAVAGAGSPALLSLAGRLLG
jgi:hypothetical protein